MYHHPGEYITDFCIVQREGIYHLFHIRGERWSWPVGYREIDLGHATSTDLRHWEPQPPVLPVGEAGAWDECGNWAPDIIEVDGAYYLYYTGSDRNNNQAIGLATSQDLYHWEIYPHNPVVEPGPWSDRHVGRDVAGRDAMVFADEPRARYLLYYTATMADGRACIALAESTDLRHWQDLGPTYVEEDRSFNRLESAYLVPHGGRYYLFYSAKGGPKSKGYSPTAFDHFDIVYLVSDDPTGGWQKPHNHVLLAEWTCASEHPTFDGESYMLYIIQEEIRGIWGASLLSDPRRMVWMADGTVQIREHLPGTVEERRLFDSQAESFGEWVQHGQWTISAEGRVTAPGGAGDAFLMDTRWGADLAFEGTVQGEAGSIASLIVRGNPSAMAGYRVSLDYARGVVGLYLRFPGADDLPLQERPVDLDPATEHHLKVVVQRDIFELFVDGALQIVRHERTYPDGCYGLHAHGAVHFQNVRAVQHLSPGAETRDWQQRCRPRHLFKAD
jgi:beta-fructofuranosidase